MQTKIQKWGNSQGIRIPKKMLDHTQIRVGEVVNISFGDGRIIIETTHEPHGRFDIKALAGNMPSDYTVGEERWGEPVGREAW